MNNSKYLQSGILTAFLLFQGMVTFAQGTLEDYQRAEAFNGTFQNKVMFAPEKFFWNEDGSAFVYGMQTAKGYEFISVDTKSKVKKNAFDQEKLVVALSAATGKQMDALHLPFREIRYNKENNEMVFSFNSIDWTYDPTKNQLERVVRNQNPRNTGFFGNRAEGRNDVKVKSPDGVWVAYIKEFNVYFAKSDDLLTEYKLTADGNENGYYSNYLSWSPNSKMLATNKITPGDQHPVYLIESSPKDQLQPKLLTRNYLKPGDKLLQMQQALFDISSKKQIKINDQPYANQYSMTPPQWRKDSRAYTFEYNQRGHQQYTISEVRVDGTVRDLVKEQRPTFFDYSGKKFRFDIEDGKETIWMSERDGWNHLYLYGNDGKVKNQITKGEWVVRRVINVDEKERTILFEGSGKEKGQDPYFIQYYRVNFDGSGFTILTNENGNHVASFNKDFTQFVDTYSSLTQPQVTVLKNAKDGKVILTLENANIDALIATGWKMPEIFTAKGRDGKTDIWGMIVRPSNFDPTKKYPIIEYIYAGPHDSFVPKSFVVDSRGSLHELAELGFIVVQIDGMGTSNRSKAFHDVCWKNLKDAGFPDRIAWMKTAARKYPYMNLEKVGIYGNSAGGQSSAGALIFHPEFYKVAVSSSGCHDNRMDKIWWNEQWMGYPIGPQYAESSNVDNAYKLQGKLLLILGELDDNVDPSSTMQVIDKLIAANKNFDFLMVPGMKHSLGGDYGEHKRRDFFVKNLLGVDPPEWTWKPNITIAKP